jgi:hypothetical protein
MVVCRCTREIAEAAVRGVLRHTPPVMHRLKATDRQLLWTDLHKSICCSILENYGVVEVLIVLRVHIVQLVRPITIDLHDKSLTEPSTSIIKGLSAIAMPWLSEWSFPLPEEDLISYTFDHCDYDKDTPVSDD